MAHPPRRRVPWDGEVRETTLRLALLSVASAAVNAYAWDYVYRSVSGEEYLSTYYRCQSLPTSAPDGSDSPFLGCLREYYVANLWFVVLFLGVALVVSVLLFSAMPAVLGRRLALTPLGPSPAARAVRDLADHLGVRCPPVLVDRRPHSSARVVAGARAPRLVLSFGVLPLARSRPEIFRALVAHELGHIANGDVRRSEFALALWWASVLSIVAAVLAGVVLNPFEVTRPWIGLAKYLALVVVAYLLLGALLRAREHDADLYAVAHVGDAALREVFDERRDRRTRVRLLSVHPPTGERRRVLVEGRSSFSYGDLLAIGVVAYLPIGVVDLFAAKLTTIRITVGTDVGLAAVLFAMGAGTGLWSANRRYGPELGGRPRPARLQGLCLAAGVLLAFLAAPSLRTEDPALLTVRDAKAAVGALILLTVWWVAGSLVVRLSRAWWPARRRLVAALGLLTATCAGGLAWNVTHHFLLLLYGELEMPLSGHVEAAGYFIAVDPWFWLLLAGTVLACGAGLVSVARPPARARTSVAITRGLP